MAFLHLELRLAQGLVLREVLLALLLQESDLLLELLDLTGGLRLSILGDLLILSLASSLKRLNLL